MRIALLAACWLGLVLCPVAASAQQSLFESAPAVLKPGDQVRIQVIGREEMSGEFMVAGDSTIRHPVYRSVKVAGIPFAEAEERIRRVLLVYQTSPQFVFEPLLQVAVAGEVRSPELYAYPPEVTIGLALGRAGGATTAARLDRVLLTRDGVQHVIDLRDPRVLQLTIRSGDQIMVPARSNMVAELLTPGLGLMATILSLLNLFK